MVAVLDISISPVIQQKIVLERAELPKNHPVAIAHDVYTQSITKRFWAPAISDLISVNEHRLTDYTMLLAPTMSFGEPDCKIMLRGEKIPGTFDPESSSGRSYSEFLRAETDIEPSDRLCDIFGSMTTCEIFLAEIRSPFRSSLNVIVYRGIFPIWTDRISELWAALVCAPKYVEFGDDQRRVNTNSI